PRGTAWTTPDAAITQWPTQSLEPLIVVVAVKVAISTDNHQIESAVASRKCRCTVASHSLGSFLPSAMVVVPPCISICTAGSHQHVADITEPCNGRTPASREPRPSPIGNVRDATIGEGDTPKALEYAPVVNYA